MTKPTSKELREKLSEHIRIAALLINELDEELTKLRMEMSSIHQVQTLLEIVLAHEESSK